MGAACQRLRRKYKTGKTHYRPVRIGKKKRDKFINIDTKKSQFFLRAKTRLNINHLVLDQLIELDI